MGATFLIMLREGLEIALVLSIVLAYLNKSGSRERHATVWAGAGTAAAVSIAAGAIIFAVAGELPHRAGEVFEGVATLLAVGVLTWMLFWMRRNAAFLRGKLQHRVDVALEEGSSITLAAVAFFVVLREGLETALFLFSSLRATSDTQPALAFTGALLGLAGAAVLGYLFYRGGIRLNLRVFFRVTGLLLLVVAATLLVYGLHELTDAGAFRALEDTFLLGGAGAAAIPLKAVGKALVGLGGGRTWLELVAWAGYLLVVGGLFLRPVPAPAAPPAARATTGDEPDTQASDRAARST
ncbi:MAG TPA: FTR1 family protein [Actinomycetota bacterium]|nr:FTR1 family protein [Actinomycetota bacterium]